MLWRCRSRSRRRFLNSLLAKTSKNARPNHNWLINSALCTNFNVTCTIQVAMLATHVAIHIYVLMVTIVLHLLYASIRELYHRRRRRQRERHKFAYLVGKKIGLHALHVRLSFLSISLPSSAKLQREIDKSEVLWRTSDLGDKFSFSLLN